MGPIPGGRANHMRGWGIYPWRGSQSHEWMGHIPGGRANRLPPHFCGMLPLFQVCIGSEMSGGVTNVTVEGCHFSHVHAGIRIKSSAHRGAPESQPHERMGHIPGGRANRMRGWGIYLEGEPIA
eukprot:1195433-Prorocentrum_minimum.AAC.1